MHFILLSTAFDIEKKNCTDRRVYLTSKNILNFNKCAILVLILI